MKLENEIGTRILINMPKQEQKLTFDEEAFLALYAELFNRCYEVCDDREFEVIPNLKLKVRHLEMQDTCYIFENTAHIGSKFASTWNWKGPYSPGLQVLLNELDKKPEAIKTFYFNYNQKREKYYKDYVEQLEEILDKYLYKEDMKKIATTCHLLENIIKVDGGSELISSMIYIATVVIPHGKPEWIFEELTRRNIGNQDLYEEVYKDLAMLGVIKIEKKSFTRIRKKES